MILGHQKMSPIISRLFTPSFYDHQKNNNPFANRWARSPYPNLKSIRGGTSICVSLENKIRRKRAAAVAVPQTACARHFNRQLQNNSGCLSATLSCCCCCSADDFNFLITSPPHPYHNHRPPNSFTRGTTPRSYDQFTNLPGDIGKSVFFLSFMSYPEFFRVLCLQLSLWLKVEP